MSLTVKAAHRQIYAEHIHGHHLMIITRLCETRKLKRNVVNSTCVVTALDKAFMYYNALYHISHDNYSGRL